MNGLCAGVQDSNVLVQRNSLELLMGIFPMHNNYLGKTDMISLVTAALTTIQRRDISLNRRLYAWLLGTDINASEFDAEHPMIKLMGELGEVPQSSLYFDMYSKENLIQVSLKLKNEMCFRFVFIHEPSVICNFFSGCA